MKTNPFIICGKVCGRDLSANKNQVAILLNPFDALAPSALTLTVLSDTSIKLDWTNNSVRAEGHKIERSTNGTTYTEVATVTGATATLTQTGLTEGTRYYYRLRAYKGTVYSDYCTAANDWTAIKAVLTATGTGAGVSTVRYWFGADVAVTLDGNGKWYSDAAGTLNESTSFTFVGGALRTRYLKVTSGVSNMLIFAKGNWLRWGDNTAEGFVSSTNAATIAKDITNITSLTALNVQGSNTLSGSVAGLTSLTYLNVAGSNTLSGSVAGLTSLTTLIVAGSNTISGSVAGLTSLTTLLVAGFNTISGSVAGLTSLTFLLVSGSNTLSGSVAGLTSLTYLQVTGSNTLSGSVAGLTSLTIMSMGGFNTLTGSIAGLTSLTFLLVSGSNTLEFPNVTNITGLCYLYVHTTVTLTSTNVNQILADFWANRNAAKSRTERNIDIKGSVTSGAPTGQGITDAAALAAYRSPTPPGTAALWTILTR